jgi:solute:Na+ symporter, SSS family
MKLLLIKAFFYLVIFWLRPLDTLGQVVANTKTEWFTWKEDPALNMPVAASAGFVGFHNEVLIYAGGNDFDKPVWEGGKKYYSNSIYSLNKNLQGKPAWKKAGELPFRIAEGATVDLPGGILCLGGTDGEKKYADVFLLKWDSDQQAVSLDPKKYPPLPEPCANPAAALLGSKIYLMGGKGKDNKPMQQVWVLNIASDEEIQKGWQTLASWPGPARFGAALVKQHNGETDCLYLLSGKSDEAYLADAYVFNPSEKNRAKHWKRIKDLPQPALLAPATSMGPAHILVFSGSDGHDLHKIPNMKGPQDYQFSTDILAYHTITNTWTKAGKMPQGLVGSRALAYQNQILLPGGEICPSVRTAKIQVAALSKPNEKRQFAWLDYGAIGGYFLLISLIGIYFNKKKKSSDDFLRGGQSMPFWAVGISVMATQVSAVGFMTIPAKAYATNWTYFAGVFTWFLIVPIVNRAFIPFYRKLNLTSAYEYLEARFDHKVRLLAATIFILFQLVRMGLVLYLPALALSSVMSIDIVTSIIAMGLFSTLYTALGGIEAVIWIEVAQAILLFGGALLCCILAIYGLDGGLSQFWEIATQNQKFSLGTTDWDWVNTGIWVILLGNIFNRLGNLTSDQAIVQRYMTTPNLKAAQRSLWADVAASIPWAIVIYGLGTALFAFFQQNPGMLNPAMPTDSILPAFLSMQAPAGICGLIIAGIFAASMSTLESSIHSVATISFTDFYSRFKPALAEKEKLSFLKKITFFIGGLATLISIALPYLEIKSLLDFFSEALGIFAGASMGLFFLGIFSKRANAIGAFSGVLITAAVLFYLMFYSSLNFWLFSVIGLLTCFISGILISIISGKPANHQGLSVFSKGAYHSVPKKNYIIN